MLTLTTAGDGDCPRQFVPRVADRVFHPRRLFCSREDRARSGTNRARGWKKEYFLLQLGTSVNQNAVVGIEQRLVFLSLTGYIPLLIGVAQDVCTGEDHFQPQPKCPLFESFGSEKEKADSETIS